MSAEGDAAEESQYRVHALAVLPVHVHWVMGWHENHVETMAAHIKARMTRVLNESGMNPAMGRSPWARNHWSVYIDDAAHLRTAIR